MEKRPFCIFYSRPVPDDSWAVSRERARRLNKVPTHSDVFDAKHFEALQVHQRFEVFWHQKKKIDGVAVFSSAVDCCTDSCNLDYQLDHDSANIDASIDANIDSPCHAVLITARAKCFPRTGPPAPVPLERIVALPSFKVPDIAK
jgi:hypothetical protein